MSKVSKGLNRQAGKDDSKGSTIDPLASATSEVATPASPPALTLRVLLDELSRSELAAMNARTRDEGAEASAFGLPPSSWPEIRRLADLVHAYSGRVFDVNTVHGCLLPRLRRLGKDESTIDRMTVEEAIRTIDGSTNLDCPNCGGVLEDRNVGRHCEACRTVQMDAYRASIGPPIVAAAFVGKNLITEEQFRSQVDPEIRHFARMKFGTHLSIIELWSVLIDWLKSEHGFTDHGEEWVAKMDGDGRFVKNGTWLQDVPRKKVIELLRAEVGPAPSPPAPCEAAAPTVLASASPAVKVVAASGRDRIRVDLTLDPPQVVLDGTSQGIDRDSAIYLHELIEANGRPVSFNALRRARPELDGCVGTRLIGKLPLNIRDFVVQKGKGSQLRLDVEKLNLRPVAQ